MQPFAPEPPQPPQQVEQADQQENLQAAPPPPAVPDMPEPPSGLGFGAAVGVGAASLNTDLDTGNAHTLSGGVFAHVSGAGFSGKLSGAVRLSGLLGGGTSGLESVYGVHAFIGGGGMLGEHTQLFTRIGFDQHSLKNDEAEASITTLPALQIGIQSWHDGWGFELAPRIGMAARTEYEPGDESNGRRHWRRLGVRAGAGGSALFVLENALFLDGTFDHVLDGDPVDVVDGRLCLVPGHVALCAFGQYWHSVATVPLGSDAFSIPTYWLGGSIGFGGAESGRQHLF